MEPKPGQFMMKTNYKYVEELINRYPNLKDIKDDIIESIDLLIKMYKNGGKLLICGNGGSASDSQHIVGELMKSFIKKRSLPEDLKLKINDDEISDKLEMGLPAISLMSELAFQTAFQNDKEPKLSFAQGVLSLGKSGDTLLCISTSGNSKNCVYAAKVAKAINLNVISLTGAKDSLLKELSNITIKAPELITYKIQELHLPIYHAICLELEDEFF